MESKKDVTDAEVELANAKEASHFMESWAFADWSAMPSTREGRDHVQGEMAATLAKFQVATVAPTDTLDILKRCSSNAQTVETAVQEHINSNLHNYAQTVFLRFNKTPRRIN